MAGKRLYKFVDVKADTPVYKLGVFDQLHVLLRQLTHDDADDLANEDIANQEILTLKANLKDFIDRATKQAREGKVHVVVVNVDSKFKPVLREVLTSKDITEYYYVRLRKPKVEYDGVELDYQVEFTVKEGSNG